MLAYPVRWHLVLMCIAHLDIITEYIVITDLQGVDSGPNTLSLLQVVQVILPSVVDFPEVIQLL